MATTADVGDGQPLDQPEEDQRTGRRRTAAAGLIGVADQAVFSIGNMLFFLVLARQSTDNIFNLVATGMLVYESLQLALRGTFAQPASLLLPSMFSSRRARQLASGQLGYVLLLAMGCTLVVGVAELLLLSGFRLRILLGVSFLFIPIMFQEGVRAISFAMQRPKAALISDVTWTAIQLIGTIVLLSIGAATPGWLITLWGVGAAAGAVAGLASLHLVPRLRYVGDWLAAVEPLAGKLTVENLLSALQTQAVSWIVLGVVGPSGVGAIRGIRTLFGPANALRAGLRQAVLPILRRRIADDRQFVSRASAMAGLVIAVVGVVSGLIVILLPAGFGAELLGETFPAAQDLAAVYTVFIIGSAAVITCQIMLMADRLVGQVVRARAVLAATTLALVPIGAVVDGAFGALVAAAVAQLLSLPFWFGYVRRADLMPPNLSLERT
jgi:hypothetical protein